MSRIDVIEDTDYKSKDEVQPTSWRDYLEVNGFNKQKEESLEDMCTNCIADQMKKHGKITIKCTGLTTFKNRVEREYAPGVYETLAGTMSEADLDIAEQTENSYHWMNRNVDLENIDRPDKRMFVERFYQKRINNCSAPMKVLRMGRRCVDGEERIQGRKKSYSTKHLHHLLKHHKRVPEILAYDSKTSSLVYTDKYIVIPNPDTDTIKLTLSNGHSTSVTAEHPLFVFKDKQFRFEEAQDIELGDILYLADNTVQTIIKKEYLKNRRTYHVSVLYYETFVSHSLIIQHNTGKALPLNTPIPTPSGWKTMGDLQVGDRVFDDEGTECNVTYVTPVQMNRDCYDITFDNGDKITADAEHQWAVSTRTHRAKALKEGKSVSDCELVLTTEQLLDFKTKFYAIRLTQPVQYPSKDLLIDPYVLGYWLGDGTTSSGDLTIGDQDAENSIEILASKGVTVTKNISHLRYKVEGLKAKLKELGVLNNKHIPQLYLQGSVEQRLELLRGLLDSDGTYLTRDDSIEFSTTLEVVSTGFKELLASVGIKSSIKKNKSFLNGVQHKDRYRFSFKTQLKVFNLTRKDKNSKEPQNTRSNYLYIKNIEQVESIPVKCISVDSPRSLYLASKNYTVTHNTYTMTIGLLHRLVANQDYKVLMVAPMATMIDEVVDQIKKMCSKMEVNPIISSTASPIAEIKFSTGSSFKGVTAGAHGAKAARGKAANLLYLDECFPPNARVKLPDNTTRAIEDIEVGDYILSYNLEQKRYVAQKVTAVRCTGRKEVYKYYTVTEKKLEATVNHPVLTSEGWKPIDEAIDIAITNNRNSSIFFESIIRKQFKGIDKVYNLEVENTHNFIVNDCIVHNCDFLRPADLDSVLGILADNVNTELWASSTPIGETNLYKLSKDAKFKEFHYPSYVIPHYGDDLEEMFRSQLSTIGYNQEVLGEYGSDSDAVFQLQFIESCILDAEYEVTKEQVLQRRNDYIVIIGVDWNHDVIGTRVVVLAYNKTTGKFLIAHKDTVSQEGWTQMLAIQKIIDLNREFNADEIYADEGFGISQVTMLRKYGLEQAGKVPHGHPDLRLLDTVAVNFRHTISQLDPISGEVLKKATKQYIVENMANILSRSLIILQEEKDSAIILQLKNYILKSKSANGSKVFGYRDKQIGDHDLDALMIAVHGFLEKYSDMTNFASNVGIAQMVSRVDRGYPNDAVIANDSLTTYIQSADIIMNTRNSLKNASRHSRTNFKTRKKW